MIVSINQPAYLPWLGYFHRIARSDVHIVLDDVQFEKNSFINRNKIATAKDPIWLTVPVHTKGRYGDLAISGLKTASNIHWRRKHWDSIRFNYCRAPHFSEHASYFEQLYVREWPLLNDLLREITRYLLNALGIGNKILFSSEMGITGRKQQLVLNLCKAVGADTYLSGPVGRGYLDVEDFNSAGIALHYHDYHHPRYCQLHPTFRPYMAAIDLLFNHGPDSLAILSGERKADLRCEQSSS